MFRSGVVVGSLAVFVAIVSSACSEPAQETNKISEPPAPEPVLDGVYLASDTSSELRGIIFTEKREYTIAWGAGSRCVDPVAAGGACIEHGSFSFNGDRTRLDLKDGESGQVTSLPFASLDVPSSSSEGLVRAKTLRPLDDDNNRGTLTTPGGDALVTPTQRAARINNQPVQLVNVSQELISKLGHCFTNDWSAMRMQERTDNRYNASGFINTLLSGLAKPMGWLFNGIGYVLFYGSRAETTLQSVEREMRATIQRQSMQDYQRAALVTCVSANIISYGNNLTATFLGASGAVSQSEGVCREFASIAKRLFSTATVNGGVQLGMLQQGNESGGHAWNWVTLSSQNATFWMEPQQDGSSGVPFFNRRNEPSPCESSGMSFCTTDAATCQSAPAGTTMASGASCAGATGGSQCCTMLLGMPM